MSRPIPEGVDLPHPNAVILGWGGEFKTLPEERSFRGWQFYPYLGHWRESNFEGWDDDAIYAADRESEVALLNRKPVPLNSGEAYSSEVVRVNSDQNPDAAYQAGVEVATDQEFADRILKTLTDKDALIRELVEILKENRALANSWSIYYNGTEDKERWHPIHRSLDDRTESALTLARTTCPEAFNGCYENSTS